MNKWYSILFFCTFSVYSFCAPPKLSRYEKRWALWHPLAALKIKKQLPQALKLYEEVKAAHLLDQYESGGKLDAFRHTFTMAYLAQSIPVKKLRKLGVAHEKGNYLDFKHQRLENAERPDSLLCDMDLKNNETGFFIAKAQQPMSGDSLKQYVVDLILKGGAWYLKRDREGRYVDCSGHVIDSDLYKGKWFVPKCLVKTNE